MSKGFFIVRLTTESDKEMIFGSKWIVNQRQLRIIDWYPGFNQEKQRTSHAATWVRFPGLHMELWTELSLLAMRKALETPIVVYQRTLDLEYGHFAVVLVDIDYAKHIPERIRLSAGGRKFCQYIHIPLYPKLCSMCNIIGHVDDECKRKAAKSHVVKMPTKEDDHQLVHVEKQPETTVHSKQVWQLVKNKKSGTNGPEKTIDVLEEDVANSEATLRKAANDLERARQAVNAAVQAASGVKGKKWGDLPPGRDIGREVSLVDKENNGLLHKSNNNENHDMDSDARHVVSATNSVQLTNEEHEVLCTITKFDIQQKNF
ncbi:uncharacterized protein LOC113316025 [Papaver somniferum]|uniref:uncharacterized protein LOC113316025 n=1 Tax=Papaver somniferum TaxID=3469 RepID=UPI000E6FE6E2|nr:uncharacterized protein LOC113316025 [Papaver somniferum]